MKLGMDKVRERNEARRKKNKLTVREDASRYLKANGILNELRTQYKLRRLTPNQFETMRKRAVEEGDIDGVTRDLAKIVRGSEAV